MGRGRRSNSTLTNFALLLLILGTTCVVTAEDAVTVDARVKTFDLQAGESEEIVFDARADTVALVAWACSACEIEIDGDYAMWTRGASSTGQINTTADGEVTVRLTTVQSESVRLMVIPDVTDNYPHLRPAPGEDTQLVALERCENPHACMDQTANSLAAQIPETEEDKFLFTGIADSEYHEFMTFEVSAGDTLEWQWLAATNDVNVLMYKQNSTAETILTGSNRLDSGYSELNGESAQSMWWSITEPGRVVARISSNSSRTVWAANVMLHSLYSQQSLVGIDLTQPVKILGHQTISSIFDWKDVELLHLSSPLGTTTLHVDQFFAGSWVAGSVFTLEAGEHLVVYPYQNTTAGKIRILNTPAFLLNLYVSSFADSAGKEAPSYLPDSLEADNSSWPLLNLTSTSEGEFTLAIGDTVDTYRIEIEGWEDSIHFVQFEIYGEIDDLELQLWDIDQSNGQILATDITRPLGNELKIGLQVGRGSHFFQIRFQNSSDVAPSFWGEDIPSRHYSMKASYALIDEGEEPWFPPDDAALFWGSMARWFLGLLFLIPVLALFISMKKAKSFAKSIAEKQQRLAWYSARLNSGESTIQHAQIDLIKALHAVAQLDWQEGLATWGEHSVQHRTEDVAIAVWQVDQRLSHVENSWPMVIGVHVLNGSWNIAALRFDAPSGEPFTVVHVEPRFLFQGEEVFLDELHEGHRLYTLIELKGSASSVDIELNGRINSTPFAAKIPETIQREQTPS